MLEVKAKAKGGQLPNKRWFETETVALMTPGQTLLFYVSLESPETDKKIAFSH